MDSLFPPELIIHDADARALRTACRAGDARTTLLAFRRPSIDILRHMLSSPTVRTHDELDRLGPDQATRAVRALLVEYGLLPQTDLHLLRFERWIPKAAASINDPLARRAFTQFATWQHLRQLREGLGPVRPSLARSRRRELRVVSDLLAWAERRSKQLGTLTQSDLDSWALTGPERHLVRKFLGWCERNRLCPPLEVRRPPSAELSVVGATDADRARLLRSVAIERHDLEASTRLAACLLLLYGVRPHQLVQLRVNDLDETDGLVRIHIGPQPLFLPAEFSFLASLARDSRTAERMFTPVEDHEWLFPGRRSGMSITSDTLTARLRRAGIRVSPARTGALVSLAQTLPPSVLADLTGVHLRTAIAWREAVASSNAHYAALNNVEVRDRFNRVSDNPPLL